MPIKRISTTLSIGGVSISGRTDRTGEGQLGQEVTLPAGKAGTLTTRTDDNTGVATLATGHGIVTSDKVDVFWADGVRYGMTANVTGDAVTVDGGAGDVLPAATTPVVVTKEVEINADFDGDDALIVAAMSTKRAHLQFVAADNSILFAIELANANEPWTWVSGQGIANPLTGDAVDRIVASNGDSGGVGTLTFACLYDSVA
jgi:hypothetical protein